MRHLDEHGAACALKSGSTEGYQACRALKYGSTRVTSRRVHVDRTEYRRTSLVQSFACITKCCHFCDSNLQPSSITFCYYYCAEEYCVISPCWMKKNDVAKMRQAGTAPATGRTIYCPLSLWCTVIYKLCSVMDTTNTFCELPPTQLRRDPCLTSKIR